MTTKIIYYYISYGFTSLVLALIMVFLIRPLAFRLGAVDKGTGRRVHDGVVPRLGGIGIFLAFTIPMAFFITRGVWGEFHDKIIGILIASTVIFAIGIYDDIKGAAIRNKLIGETLAALVIYAWGIRITTISSPWGGIIDLGWLSLPATVLWIIVITNAINLIDGLDGLAAGTGILVAGTMFLFSGETDVHLKVTLVVIIGSLLGFLRYNFPPASIFMGDSGSLFLGFLLGSISIAWSYKAQAMATMMIPLLAFGLPLMDMLYAVLRRYYRGIPLGQADREHIHHKLLEKGLSRRKVVLFLYLINIILAVLIVLIIRQKAKYDLFCLVLLFLMAIIGLRLVGYIKFLPTIKEILREYNITKKRRYFNYVIRRFRRSVAKSRTMEDLIPPLSDMMKEYSFCKAEIQLNLPEGIHPLYLYNGRDEPDKPLLLSFPILHEGKHLGEVTIIKGVDDDYFLCVAEMIKAITEEISKFYYGYLEEAKQYPKKVKDENLEIQEAMPS